MVAFAGCGPAVDDLVGPDDGTTFDAAEENVRQDATSGEDASPVVDATSSDGSDAADAETDSSLSTHSGAADAETDSSLGTGSDAADAETDSSLGTDADAGSEGGAAEAGAEDVGATDAPEEATSEDDASEESTSEDDADDAVAADGPQGCLAAATYSISYTGTACICTTGPQTSNAVLGVWSAQVMEISPGDWEVVIQDVTASGANSPIVAGTLPITSNTSSGFGTDTGEQRLCFPTLTTFGGLTFSVDCATGVATISEFCEDNSDATSCRAAGGSCGGLTYSATLSSTGTVSSTP